MVPSLTAALLVLLAVPAWGTGFVCAGVAPGAEPAARVAAGRQLATGTRSAAVLFAHRRGELSDTGPPAWSAGLFDPDRPGSLSHFYDTMSLGAFHLTGTVLPRRYAGPRAPDSYGDFVRDVLRQADADTDFSRFDHDGDGVVDALFVNLHSTAGGFLRGGATGIFSLGFDGDYVTDDVDAAGRRVRIDPRRGTVQRTVSFAEAAGTMAHEYGHVLGLPDLYDVAFLEGDRSDPALDSAGIGDWGLMGWGTDGWHGDDGPAAFSGVSRLLLGWARVAEVAALEQRLHLSAVGLAGDLFRVPLGAGEYFLLEYRPVDTTPYDRNLPGAGGLLVWHVWLDPDTHQRRVDLEAADGRWADAGYPAGEEADPVGGGDNLDWWAHDAGYAVAHAGNLGDATDPFDGLAYAAFTPDTNPAAVSRDGSRRLWLDDIDIGAGAVSARLRVGPPALRLVTARVVDASGDDILAPGESGSVVLRLFNEGGLAARDVEVRLASDDPLLQVTAASARFAAVRVGRYDDGPVAAYPTVRLDPAFSGARDFVLDLRILVDGQPVRREQVRFAAVSSVRLRGRVTDARGQGLPGIGVRLLRVGEARRTATFRTDEDGRFVRDLVPGDYLVNVARPNAPPVLVTVTATDDESLEIALPDLYPVTGLVTDSRGEPLSGALVRALGPGGTAFAQSGIDGRYTLELPAGYHAVTASLAPSTVDAPLLAWRWRADLVVDGPARLDIALVESHRLAIEVRDPQGNPVAATLRLQHPVEDVILSVGDEQSLPTFAVVSPGRYRLNALAPLPRPWLLRPSPFYEVHGDLRIDLRAERGLTVRGRIADTGARRADSARLDFTPAGPLPAVVADVDAEGRFETDLLPGRYEVAWRPTAGASSPAQVLRVLDVDGATALEATTRTGAVVVGTVDGDDASEAITLVARSEAGFLGTTQPTPDGAFEMALPAGRYHFTGTRGGSSWDLGWHDVSPPAGPDLRRRAGAHVRGRVLDPTGTPVAAGQAVLVDDPMVLLHAQGPSPERLVAGPGGFVSASVVAAGGVYDLPAAPGPHFLLARQPLSAVRPVTANGAAPIDLRPPPTTSLVELYGAFHLPGGTPRGLVQLVLYDETTGRLVRETSALPNYHIRVPAGHYRARVGVYAPVRGFFLTADLGPVVVDAPRRWDIRLDAAPTAVTGSGDGQPGVATLEAAYPNPFNDRVVIPYRLAGPGRVRLTIFNVLGQPVRHLVDGRRPAGRHAAVWDATDDAGQRLASGLFLYRLRAGGRVAHRRLVLLR